MHSIKLLVSSSMFLFATATVVSAGPQGRSDYLNFESPQVEPVALAQVGPTADPYLLVCNTADNRVEVYDIANPDLPVLERRILVGLEPVSVAYKSFSNGRQMMYTANWLGDSVTYVELFSTGNVLTYKMIGTFPINFTSALALDAPQPFADEPVHVACADGGTSTTRFIFVAKRFGSSFSWLDAFTGAPVSFDPDGAGSRPSVPSGGMDVIMTNTGVFPRDANGLFTTGGAPTGSLAVKEPQCIVIPPGSTGRFWVLGQQGGGSQITFPTSGGQALPAFNMDLWTWDANNAGQPPAVLPNPTNPTADLGTTNFNAEFDSAGTLYAVATEAQNGTTGNGSLSTLPTGFAPSMLYRINVNAGSPGLSTVDGPRDLSGSGLFVGQPTDIAIYEPTSGSNAGSKFVIVAGFTGDRFARVKVANASGPLAPASWGVLSIAVPKLLPSPEMAGPRGVAVNSATQRGYFLNAVDNSIFVANLENFMMSAAIPLQNDPLPTYTDNLGNVASIRKGKKFLYSNVSSAIGMGCANCHIDARSDQLPWRLSADPTAAFDTTAAGDLLGPSKGFDFNTQFSPGTFLPYPPSFVSFVQGLLAPLPGGGFPSTGGFLNLNPKGPMITQSLQGLANFEVQADGDLGHYFSNAPYHWRGDKKTFLDFKGAFIDLQAQAGVTDPQMKEYEVFINSVHYPPNAIEPITRHYSGSIGNLGLSDGNGARRGFKLFHIENDVTNGGSNLFGGRTCSQCHEGSVSSDNRWTTVEAEPGASPVDTNSQPLNTAALRGLRQKEARLEIDSTTPPPPTSSPNFLQTGDFGMGHDGLRGFSINGFVGTTPLDATSQNDVTQFIREFDSGVAPIVGRTITVYRVDVNSLGNFTSAAAWKGALVTEMETQAQLANAGLAADFYDDDGTADGNPNDVELARGFWYKVTALTTPQSGARPYKEENASTTVNRRSLLLLMTNGLDCVTFTATPLGSERRVASLSGDASIPSGAPTSIQQIGTIPNTSNADGIGMTVNGSLTWNGNAGVGTQLGFQFPTRIQAFEAFRSACQIAIPPLITTAANQFEFPRRLRFTGVGLEEGGYVKLGIDMNLVDVPPLDPPGTSAAGDFQYIRLPIHPTNSFAGSNRIWETTVELEPQVLYMLLLGGPKGPGISETLAGNPTIPPYDPTNWARFKLSYTSPSNVSTAETLVPLIY